MEIYHNQIPAPTYLGLRNLGGSTHFRAISTDCVLQFSLRLFGKFWLPMSMLKKEENVKICLKWYIECTHYYIIQMCSGITHGRVLNGELYAQRLQVNLSVFIYILIQVRLRTEVPNTISCHWDACSNHLAISDFFIYRLFHEDISSILRINPVQYTHYYNTKKQNVTWKQAPLEHFLTQTILIEVILTLQV